MAALKQCIFSLSGLSSSLLRIAAHQTSLRTVGGGQGSKGLSWSKYSSLRSKWRALSSSPVTRTETDSEGVGENSQQDEAKGGLQLSDSCIKVVKFNETLTMDFRLTILPLIEILSQIIPKPSFIWKCPLLRVPLLLYSAAWSWRHVSQLRYACSQAPLFCLCVCKDKMVVC